MRRAITLLFVGNAVALEHQIGGIDSYSKTTTAAFPVQIHDNAPPWDARAMDEEEKLLLKNDLIVASPTPLIDGESGYYLEKTAETTPINTNSDYIIEIRSDDEAGEAMLFPRQVESSGSGASLTEGPGYLSTVTALVTEVTSTTDAPETSAPEASTNSTASASQISFSPINLPETRSSTETPTATPTSPALTSASPSSQQASASASRSVEAPAGSTPASLSSSFETAVTSSYVEPAAAPSTIAITSEFVAGNQTLVPGGTTVSLDASTTELVVGGTGNISVIPTTVYQTPQPPAIPLPGTTLTLNSVSGFVAGTQTLIPGGPVITISNTAISLAPSATAIIVDSTSTISLTPTTVYQTPQPPAIPVAGTTLTPNSASEYVAGTQTLIPGGPVITILNTAISLAPSATEIIIDSTSTISLTPTTVYQTPQPPAIPLAGTTLTLNSVSGYVVGTQTLIPGGPVITIEGTAVSLVPSATAVVVSGISTGRGASGFTTRGPNATVTATTIIEPYTGVALKNNIDGFGWWIFAILVVVNMLIN
ncbi:hypothetical protein GJ744_005543 [Endocarpon pusillum]|uniref:Uncharacterized protein n=1 Tax=Endocarpon pusillum TaxID=364733 RepID=A0A8H7AQ91_9EURO|nr:hypothetical protein GJ744_005543 [Endocarpon pusillum]